MEQVISKTIDSDDELIEEKLDMKIKDAEEELHSFDNPQTIESGLENMDPLIKQKFHEHLNKMPRNELIKLIASLGESKNNLGSDYNFGGMSQNVKKTAKERLAEKIDVMKTKRMSRFVLNKQQEKNELMKTEQEYLHRITDADIDEIDNVQNTETNVQIFLTKSQKKRMKNKERLARKKLQTISEISEIDLSDSE